jgi:MATE family multidrug resistance protein
MEFEPVPYQELPSTWECLKEINKIFLPTCLSIFFTVFIETINISFIGHLEDPFMISGVGLGTLYIYTFGFTVLLGFNSVVSTLVSQSYGQKDLRLCGIYLNRGRIVALASCLPMTFMMLISG